MSRQTLVVVGIGAVIGAALIVSRVVDFGGAAKAPVSAPAPSQPVRDTSAVPTPTPEAPARPTASTRSPRPAPAAAPTVTPEPAAAAPTMATLHITSDVPGAQIFIDRQFVGEAPVTVPDVQPGSRKINASAPGYEGVSDTIDVVPGPRDVMMSLKTIRLDESIAVKHKHGMGSCAGRLVATPDGLRYETDNKNDGFSVPLTSIETFTMDFLANNLKVKVKGGKSYDFTDPSGKADALYLFHQAVDKARQRLLSGSGKDTAQGSQ